MMKIGIMSMQRIPNYGSFLQAYALKRIIESLGHQVQFVDYHVKTPLFDNNGQKKEYHKRKAIYSCLDFFSAVRFFDFILPKAAKNAVAFERMYKKACKRWLGFRSKKNYYPDVDVLVIGSDEVFNCTQLNPRVGYSLELFGACAKSKKVVSYAASFGNTTIKKINHFHIGDEIGRYLTRMDAISVRDENSASIVQNICAIKPKINLDPALVYEFRPEICQRHRIDNYVLVYAYRGRISQNEGMLIKRFAKEKNKKIVCIGGFQQFGDLNIVCDPFELLDYFRGADFVFTDTFHGTIFSIISRKQFVTFIRDGELQYGNKEKLFDLLNRLCLTDRIVATEDDFEAVIQRSIDYGPANKIIEESKVQTKKYLEEVLCEAHRL